MREHILCVDDEEGILAALQKQLGSRFGNECEIAVAKSAADALELIDELEREGERLAMVIADQIMPGMKGVELLERVHARDRSIVKILLTGQAGLDAVVYAINHAGLDHYLGKPWDEPNLRLTVESLLEKHRMARENDRLLRELKIANDALQVANGTLESQVHARTLELERANEQLETANHQLEKVNERLKQLAVTDGLTGLFNHRFFQQHLRLEMERIMRANQVLSLLMIDVDHFKRFNDRHGHLAGDEVLRQVAAALLENRRASDVVARYGGEEFAVLLIGADKTMALEIAEQVRERIRSIHCGGPAGMDPLERVTASIGVASAPLDAQNAFDLVATADAALYTAKREGRDRVVAAAEARAQAAG